MSDDEYDTLLRKAVEYEKDNGLTEDTLGDAIAAGAKVAGTIVHDPPMLSLDNVFDEESLKDFVGNYKAVMEPKLDGMAMSILFKRGKPVQMSTRGDGVKGEDVTPALSLVSNLPEILEIEVEGERYLYNGELRGEVIFSKDQFERANTARVASGKTPFANARNAVAGTINRASKSGNVPEGTEVSFIAYDIQSDGSYPIPETYLREMALFWKAGVTIASLILEESLVSIHTKPVIDYDIDGLVSKVDSYAEREKLGSTSRAPRWAVAYKYPPDSVTTVLNAVEWNVGRTGIITPRAILSPVEVGGTVVTYATLNNPNDIARKDLRIGDTVTLRRAAEVIPEIVGSVLDMRTGNEKYIEIPTACPNCGLAVDDSMARLSCPAKGECAIDRNLVYAVSRDALDIEGMSEAMVEALVKSGDLRSVADIFYLSQDLIAATPTGNVSKNGNPIYFGDTVASKVCDEIQRSLRESSFSRILIAMGLRGTGRTMCKRLAKHFGSMSALMDASVEDISKVDKMGRVKAQSLYDQLRCNESIVEELYLLGANLEEDEDTSPKPLEGQVIVVTGSMQKLGSRDEITDRLESLGATVGSSVSAKTTVVVADNSEGASSKLVKARKLGTPILDEEEFISKFGL